MNDKKLKILFITNNYTPYSGGLVSSIQASTTELELQGHSPFIATLDFLGGKHADPANVYRVPCPIKFTYKTNHMAIPWRPTDYLANLMREIKPDIVHLHHPFLLGVAGLKSARSLDIPVVFTYHTMYEKYAHYVPILGQFAAPMIECKVLSFCKKVDGLVVPSEGIRTFLQDKKINVPMAVIPSGLRAQFLASNRDAIRYQSHQPFRLLYVGRLTQEKNIPFLLDMFAQLPQGAYSLTLVGYGAQADEYKHYAFKKLRFDPNSVQFIEKPDDLATLYAHSDLFLFPSTTDTQGIVLAESLSQGLPIVALEGCGQRDAIIEGQNGFLVPNQAAMIAAIERIAHNSSLHQALCAGAAASAARYAPHVVTDQLLTFYRTTLEKKCAL